MINNVKNLTLASMCLALGVILPQAFHAIPNAGNIFLPMHIPTLLCGFICGPIYGLIVGILSPILSHLIFSMPSAMMLSQMIVELGSYGLMIGLLNSVIKIKNKSLKRYLVLMISMLVGRGIYGVLNALLFKAGNYSISIWLASAFITSIPGIIIQLITIPILVKAIEKLIK